MSSLPTMSTSHIPRPFISGNLHSHCEQNQPKSSFVHPKRTSEIHGEERGADGQMQWTRSKEAATLQPNRLRWQQRHTQLPMAGDCTEKVVSTTKLPVLQ